MRSIYMDKDHLKLKRSKKSYFSKTFYIFLIFIILHTKKAIHIYTCELLFSFALIAFKLGIYATFSYLVIITRYHHSLLYLFANGEIKLTYKKVASTSCSKRLLWKRDFTQYLVLYWSFYDKKLLFPCTDFTQLLYDNYNPFHKFHQGHMSLLCKIYILTLFFSSIY